MRTAVGIAMVVAGLTIGALIWRSTNMGSTAIPASLETAAQEKPQAGEPAVLHPVDAPSIPEEAAVVPKRETVDEAEPAMADPPPASTDALLRVQLLAKEDRAPLKGKRLALQVQGDRSSVARTPADGPRARLGEMPLTGEDGWAEFEVEPDRDYSVLLFVPESDFKAHPVAALARGERREIEILLVTKSDVTLFGVLLDKQTAKPVAGGMLEIEAGRRMPRSKPSDIGGSEPGSSPIQVDADGRFELRGESWKRSFVSAKAPGFARTVFPLLSGHSDPSHPLEVRMSRSASVDVSVRDSSGGPIAEALVELSTKSYQLAQNSSLQDFYFAPDPTWSAKTDPNGKASVLDLPPEVPLKLLVRREGLPPREEAEALVLHVGERRAIEIPWGAGGIVQGQVIDGSGKPVPDQELWRMVSEWPTPLPVLFRRSDRAAATTRTDEQGQFRFTDVPVGIWSVGIAPKQARGGSPSGFPAYAESVDVKAEGEIVELVLRVEADLFLRGKVVDAAGMPVPRCFVSGSLENSSIHVVEQTDGAGSFAMGPLPRGNWILEAGGFGSEQAPSLPTTAQVGAEDVVLQLRTGASITGKVVDGVTLQPAECELTLANVPVGDSGWRMAGSRDGSFKLAGLLPGTYLVSARNRAGSIGASGTIQLAEGQLVEGVEIKLLRGAMLSLRYDGDSKNANYVILAGGLPIDSSTLEKGKSEEQPVPADAIEVRWKDPVSQITKSQTFTVAAGERRELVWDGKP